jgi:hypothetical protein
MSLRRELSTLVVGAVVTFLLWLWFHPRPVVEQAFAPPETLVSSPTPAPSIPPPTPAEAQEKLDQVFRRSLLLDKDTKPSLLSGDFNLDSSMDLAVAVKPRPEALAALNGEFPAWITVDVTIQLHELKAGATPPPIHIAADQPLLAIVHGHEAAGWRNPDALQGYLLVNARGSALRPVPLERAMKAAGGPSENLKFGDVLAGSRRGRAGYLLWNFGQYAWHELPAGKTLPTAGD